jgi:hypothetical protein
MWRRIFPWRRPKSDGPHDVLDDEMRRTAVAFCTTGSVYVIWGSATGTVFILGGGGDDLYDEYTVYEV